MENYITKLENALEDGKHRLVALNLQHLLRITQEQITLDNIVQSLQETLLQAHANDPSEMCDMLVTQARILDATFHFFVDKSMGAPYTQDEKMAFALKAQAQTVRTILGWQKLKSKDRDMMAKHAKRTRQNAPLDAGSPA